MLRGAPSRTRRARFEDEEPSSPPPLPGEDEEALVNDFWKNFDQTKFLRELDSYTHHAQATKASEVPNIVLPSLEPLMHAPAHQPTHSSSPEIPVEFYGQVIQILTFVLGSNPPMLADSNTPRVESWEPQHPLSNELTAEDWTTMHNVVTLIMERFGSSTPAPSTLVTTQELTRLLQKLMAKQNENEKRTAFQALPSPFPYTPDPEESVQQFLNTDFADEDDDDPDFQPPPVDDALNPAWRRALQDLTATPLPPPDPPASPAKTTRARKRAEAQSLPSLARPTSGAAAANSTLPGLDPHTLPELEPLRPDFPEEPAPRRGRRAIYTAEEARERKRERNRQHMRMKRNGERASSATSPPPDALVREAEIKFLREEVERLREENARLRGREEMRQYAARMGLPNPLPSV